MLRTGENDTRSTVVVKKDKSLFELRRGNMTFSRGVGVIGDTVMSQQEWATHMPQRTWLTEEEWMAAVKPASVALPEAPEKERKVKRTREEMLAELPVENLLVKFDAVADSSNNSSTEVKKLLIAQLKVQLEEKFPEDLYDFVVTWVRKMKLE